MAFPAPLQYWTPFHEIDKTGLHQKYLPFNRVDASIYICVPRHLAKGKANPSATDMVQLKPHIVAVKVEAEEMTSIFREVKCLKHLSQHTAQTRDSPEFVRLLDYDQVGGKLCRWYSMSTFTSCISVKDMINVAYENGGIPILHEFVLHYFIEVLGALRFLHNTCNMVHGDIHFGNVMLDTSKQKVSGFPNLVMIDFGQSEVFEKKEQYKAFPLERAEFCLSVYRLFECNRRRKCVECAEAVLHEPCSDPQGSTVFQEFITSMRLWGQTDYFKMQAHGTNRGANPPYLGNMWTRFGKWAEAGRLGLTDEKRHEMKALVWDVAKANEHRLLEDLRQTLERN